MSDVIVDQFCVASTRVVTERVGALNDHFLAARRAWVRRACWGDRAHGCEVRRLRAHLGLDSGYLSRLLRSLEAAGLVTVSTGSADRRVRVARLTAAGHRERSMLDQRSDQLARSLLAPLSLKQRERLLAAMRDVERLLTAASVQITAVDPEHPDAQRCLASYVASQPSLGAWLRPLRRGHRAPASGPAACRGVLRRLPSRCRDRLRRREASRRRAGGDQAHVDRSGCPRTRTGSPAPGAIGGVRARRRSSDRAHRNERDSDRGAVPVPVDRLGGGTGFNDEPFADHWFEKALS